MAENGLCGMKVLVWISVFCCLLQSDIVRSAECDQVECQLPDCWCAGRDIPAGLSVTDTPQMVLFTFDDAVNEDAHKALIGLTETAGISKKNPNGCPIGISLMVSHDDNDYCMMKEFFMKGHEVASHTVTHRFPIEWWKNATYQDYDDEIWGQVKNIAFLREISTDDVKGFRSPFIQPGGNNQFDVIYDRNLTYDSSLLVIGPSDEDRYWPYTLDGQDQLPCQIPPCPTRPYRGVWELPIQPIPDHQGVLCSYLDYCSKTNQSDDMYDFLFRSFNTSYNSNRAPLILNMHARFFKDNWYSFEGFNRFIDHILSDYSDVYIITASQLVDWMRSPTRVADLPDFTPWKCSQ